MELDLAVIADAANVTEDGKINIIGVFRNFITPSLPRLLPTFYIAISFTPSPSELGTTHNFEVRFKKPDNSISNSEISRVGGGTINVPRQGEYNYPMVNVLMGLLNLQVTEYGLYSFELYLDDAYVKTLPLYVSKPAFSPQVQISQPQ